MLIKLPFSVFIDKRFVTVGTEVYILPVRTDYVYNPQNTSLTVRTFNIPKPTKCLVCLNEDCANYMKIKHPELFSFI